MRAVFSVLKNKKSFVFSASFVLIAILGFFLHQIVLILGLGTLAYGFITAIGHAYEAGQIEGVEKLDKLLKKDGVDILNLVNVKRFYNNSNLRQVENLQQLLELQK